VLPAPRIVIVHLYAGMESVVPENAQPADPIAQMQTPHVPPFAETEFVKQQREKPAALVHSIADLATRVALGKVQ